MNARQVFTLIITVSSFSLLNGNVQATQRQGTSINDTIKLSGKWRFRMNPKDVSAKQNWFSEQLDDVITLPGSMTSNHLGDEISINTPWTGGIEDSSGFKNPSMQNTVKRGTLRYHSGFNRKNIIKALLLNCLLTAHIGLPMLGKVN